MKSTIRHAFHICRFVGGAGATRDDVESPRADHEKHLKEIEELKAARVACAAETLSQTEGTEVPVLDAAAI